MAGSQIADLFARLLVDDKGFKQAVTKSASDAGDAAGATMGQRMSAGLKEFGGKALGFALAGGFAIATKGIIELDNATASLQAEAGLTAEEAKRARDAILDMSSRNIQPLEEIGRALTKVHTDLGLTGDEANKTTEAFLRYARATKQDAADAVVAFDDVLDNWGLTAKDAQSIMDKLIVSHQKYGGEIEANQVSLAKLAPALRAANFEVDDAIALLGLFGSKGLDADQATAAFAKALTKVKSPAELQAAIDDIAGTADAFSRAQKAADLFGARAGAKLANALAGADLDKYKISVEEAAGATEKAADVLDSTFTAQLQLRVKALGAAIIGLGKDFGPALTGAASLASLLGALGGGKLAILGLGLGKTLGTKMLAGLMAAGLGRALSPGGTFATSLEGPVEQTGTSLGRKLGTAMSVAFAAVAVVEAVKTYGDVRDALEKQSKDLADQTGKFVKDATEDQLRAARQGIAEQRSDIGNSILMQFQKQLGLGDSRALLDKQLADIDAELQHRADRPLHGAEQLGVSMGTAVVDGVKQGLHVPPSEIDSAVNNSIRGPLAAAAAKLTVEGRRAGAEATLSIAAGIQAKRQAVDDAFAALKESLKHPMNRFKQQAHLVGILTSKELAKGLKSGDAVIRKQAEATLELTIARLQELAQGSGKLGKKAQEELEKGLRSKNPAIKKAAEDARDAIAKGVKPTSQEATGIKVVDDMTRGLQNAGARARLASSAAALRDIVRRALAGLSQAAASSGGGSTGSGTSNGQGSKPGSKFSASGNTLAAGEGSWVGEHGREWFQPMTAGVVSNTDQLRALARAATGGDHYEINVPIQGVVPVRTVGDIARPLRQLAQTGYLRDPIRRPPAPDLAG